MTRATARALRLVALAYALTASTLIVQTIVLRALAYGSASFAPAVVVFRAVFVVADLLLLFALGRLARERRSVRGLLLPACACLVLAVTSGAFDLATRAAKSDSGQIASRILGAAMLEVSTGAAVLVVLALVSAVRDLSARARRERSSMLTVVSIFAGSMVLGPTFFRVGRVIESDSQTALASRCSRSPSS